MGRIRCQAKLLQSKAPSSCRLSGMFCGKWIFRKCDVRWSKKLIINFYICVLLTRNLARKLKFIHFGRIHSAWKYFSVRKLKLYVPQFFLVTEHTESYRKRYGKPISCDWTHRKLRERPLISSLPLANYSKPMFSAKPLLSENKWKPQISHDSSYSPPIKTHAHCPL